MEKVNKHKEKKVTRKNMLLDFESADAIRSSKKRRYKYVAKNKEGKMIKEYIDAYSKVDAQSFLINQGYDVYSIEASNLSSIFIASSVNYKIKYKDLSFFLTQLSTYIKSGIPLTDSLIILERQSKKRKEKKLYQKIIYELNAGVNFSDALSRQGKIYPNLLVNMLRAAELTGKLPETLDDMAEYYNGLDENRRDIIAALTYPSAILVLAVAIVSFIMIYVVPQFSNIYSQAGTTLPKITLSIINYSNSLKDNAVTIIISIISIITLYTIMYKNIAIFRKMNQWLLMKIPVIKTVIINNEVIMFTKTFGSLLKHDVFITDSIEILGKITNNEIYKSLIKKAIVSLRNGDNMSVAFKNSSFFPSTAYEMLVTGETTGKMADMMIRVSTYYQSKQKNIVAQLKSLVEPIMIIILAIVVGIILLSIIIPMFDIYSEIG
ncbi:MAG: type II secretion system F family protein [bacterium]|nr:type II secretion system F family protein [bacterium]